MCAHVIVQLRSLSVGRRRSTHLRRARTAPHLFASVYVISKGTAPARSILSLGARLCSDMLDVAPNGHPVCACGHTRSRHCVLSLGRRRRTRACGARAPRHDGWIRSVHRTRPLHQQVATLHRRTAVLRRVSCSFLRQASGASCLAQAPLRSLSLGMRRSMRACHAHVARCAAYGRSIHVVGPLQYTRPLQR